MKTETADKIKAENDALLSVKRVTCIPTKTAFSIDGGSTQIYGVVLFNILDSSRIETADKSVATVPKSISNGKGLVMLDKKQPMVRPGIAAGVRAARIFNASDILNCTSP